MGRYILILVIGATVSYGISNLTLNKNVTRGTENSANLYVKTRTRNISNSTAEMIIAQLSDNTTWRVSTPEELSIFGGTASYTIKDTTLDGSTDLVKINIVAQYNGYTSSAITVYAVPPKDNPLRATYISNRDIIGITSDMYIDGRNYTTAGVLVPGTGTYGISTTISFTNDKTYIGGTNSGTDYAPANPENAGTVEDNVVWDGGFPTTPDEIFDLTSGTLKTIAQSGAGGSQYVTDAKNLIYPLSGVTYVDGTSGADEIKIDNKNYGVSSGLLVCFNTPSVAVRVKKTGCEDESKKAFQGIIIMQNLEHYHMSMYGTMILLSPGSDNNCSGNKDHFVRYSSQAIENALDFVAEQSGQPVAGVGTKRVTAVHWLE